MTYDPVKQALAELQDLVRCRCLPAYTVRKLRDPECDCDSAENVKVVVDHIEALDKACKEWAEVSQRNYKRAKAAEAKLAKAREALGEAWFMLTVPHLDYEPEPEEPGLRRIKTTLAELTGDKT
jgi:hypothetical protein